MTMIKNSEISDEFEIVQTEKVFNIIDSDRGKNYPSSDDYSENGYCLFLTAANVTDKGMKFDNKKYITKERHNKLNRGSINDKDIILTTRGTVGNIGIYNESEHTLPARINSGMVILRNKEQCSYYLYYLLSSNILKNQIKRITYGTAQPQTSVANIKRLNIIKPNINEQERIASVLYSVDEKLEHLHERKSKLTRLKNGLFQDLISGEYLNFNNQVEFSEESLFGNHPKKWNIARLDDDEYFNVIGSGIEEFDGEKTYISTGNVKERNIENNEGNITYQDRPSRANMEINKNGVLFAKMKDSIKVVKGTKEKSNDLIFSTGFVQLETKDDILQEYLVQLLLSNEFEMFKSQIATGSTQQAINLSYLSSFKIPVPSIEEQERIASILYTVDEMIEKTGSLIEKYERVKKGLMQDLLSGDVRTPEELEVLEEVVDENKNSKSGNTGDKNE